MAPEEQFKIGKEETAKLIADSQFKDVKILEIEARLRGSDPAGINPYANGARKAIAEAKGQTKERLAEIKAKKKEISETRKEMKESGVRRTSCFNGGLHGLAYSLNARMFQLETELERLQKKP